MVDARSAAERTWAVELITGTVIFPPYVFDAPMSFHGQQTNPLICESLGVRCYYDEQDVNCLSGNCDRCSNIIYMS